jgi:hypothetical protein
LDAAREYLANHAVNEVKLGKAVEEFLAEKEKAGSRSKTTISYRSHLKALRADYEETMVGRISAATLLGWFDRRGLTGTTRDNYRRTFVNFFGWCRRLEYCLANPA